VLPLLHYLHIYKQQFVKQLYVSIKQDTFLKNAHQLFQNVVAAKTSITSKVVLPHVGILSVTQTKIAMD
jgi:hypothetical protein